MVDGEVVSGSLCRRYYKLEVSPELPSEVIDYAQATAALYSPARARSFQGTATDSRVIFVYDRTTGECRGQRHRYPGSRRVVQLDLCRQKRHRFYLAGAA